MELVPGMQIATDVICGFPGETDEDFAETVDLIRDYKLAQVHISQFYPRPGTPAARMKKVPSNVVKQRSRELTAVFESFTPYTGMEGKVERVWISDIASDGVHLVGHTKGYIQVLVIGPQSMLGTSAMVKIASVGRWSVFGEVIEILCQNNKDVRSHRSFDERCSPCALSEEACACSKEQDPCSATSVCCSQSPTREATLLKNGLTQDNRSRNLIGWFLRNRKNQSSKKMDLTSSESKEKQIQDLGRQSAWNPVDIALLCGILLSLFTIVALFLNLGSRSLSHK